MFPTLHCAGCFLHSPLRLRDPSCPNLQKTSGGFPNLFSHTSIDEGTFRLVWGFCYKNKAAINILVLFLSVSSECFSRDNACLLGKLFPFSLSLGSLSESGNAYILSAWTVQDVSEITHWPLIFL